MKKLFLYYILPVLLPLGAILMIGPGCGSTASSPVTPTPVGCNTVGTEVSTILSNAVTSGGLITEQSACAIHRYYFTVSANKTICKIGYKGNDSAYLHSPQLPYGIQIEDNNGNVLYNGSHVFDHTAMSYVSISPVNLVPGTVYIISRYMNNPPSAYYLTGDVLQNNGNAINFPLQSGVVSIVASALSGGTNCNTIGGDYDLPKIDIVFQ